MPIKGMWHL